MNNSNREIGGFVGHALYSMIGTGAQGAVRFAATVLVGRIAGLDVLAAFSSAMALTMIVALVYPTGAGIAAARLIAATPDPHDQRRQIRHVVARNAPAIAALALGAGIVDLVLFHSSVALTGSVMLLAFSYSMYVLTRAMQIAGGMIRRAAVWDAACALASFIGVAILATVGAVDVLLLPLALAYLLCAVQALGRPRSRSGTPLATGVIRRLQADSLWNSAGVVTANALPQVAMIGIYAVASPTEAGLFAAALAIATATTMAAQAVAQVLLPRVTAWVASARAGHARNALLMSWLATVIGYLALGVLAEPVLATLFGVAFVPATGQLQVLSFAMAAFSIAALSNTVLIALHRERTLVGVGVIALGFGVVVSVGLLLADEPILSGLVGITVASSVNALVTGWIAVRALRALDALKRTSEVPQLPPV